ncbi:serine/threonine-protein kinase [Streptomyces griseocarneus]|uniref:serine/threonine-protein kinase n=1 Tax=Streptomyces griseocarneus TaxID=51201 RepID=UPI00167D872E|nr:serine/threonine-protein kinase [Streptomyces griseocarneus]MBZ6477732.1 serine/threonine-protein kinase [Streptomyces griseocarneus]GHG81651.1 serine/threonine protein kinase [Streptomyces griseocarneus]
MPPLRGTGTGPQADDPEYAGQYRLERRLGSGGMGVVHLARSASGLRLAVKVVHAEYAVDPEFRARFRQEVAAARRVSGAFTASVVDADPDSERPWMATLYVPGPTLSERVKRNGPLRPGEVRRLAAGLAEALRDIHRAGLVHRDLKPSNVLLAEDGPKVIDFGISRPYDSELRTETGKLIGTPPFMAPEQFQRPREVGPAADVFALASLLVHAATGRGPFESESPYIVAYQVVHDEPDLTGVPADLVPLIRACLAKEPADRPTPDAIMAMLPAVSEAGGGEARTAEAAEAIPAAARRTDGPPARPGSDGDKDIDKPRRRRVRWLALAAAVVVALGAGGAWALNEIDGLGRQPSHARPAPAGASWKPWETSVPEDAAGKGEVRAGFCTHTGGALYCSARGVHAARIDAATGKVAWRRPGEAARAGGGTPSAPVVSGGLVHALSPDKRELVALDPATGDPRWTRDVSSYGGRVYHAGDTVLLVAADGTVTAVDGGSNRELWRHGLPGGIKPVFSFYGSGPAYALAPSADGRRTTVVAMDAARGTTSWQWTADGALTAVGTGPGGILYLTASDSRTRVAAVVRYAPGIGRERRIPLSTPLEATSAVPYGESVYVLSSDGGLTALHTGRGVTDWRLDTSVANASALVAAEGRLYFSAADGRLLAVDTAKGALLGTTSPRLARAGRGFLEMMPAPVTADGKVFGAAPDGTVFAVDGRNPSRWR